ncbi:MAG TPA: adenosine kinase [Candidatus Hydrogenedentes bacterium]|nr:adenosine kinase [Candidatus Hydrogenedentota bacterium]
MKTNSDTAILGVGSPIVDLLAQVPESFLDTVPGAKGGMELVAPEAMDAIVARLPAPPVKAPGGSAANTVCALIRLGMPVGLLGKMGEDDMAAVYCRAFSALGGDCSRFKTTAEKPTARCLSLITPDGERTMRTDLGAAKLLAPDEVTLADFDGYSHVHIEGYALLDEPLTLKVLEMALEHSCSVSLDLGSFETVRNTRGNLERWLRDYVDIVFANEDEARAFCGDDSPEKALDAFGEVCAAAAVKLGACGAWLQSAGERVYVPAHKVDTVVDTTGAGDCWAAGFLYGHLKGLPLAATGELAAFIGAETVTTLGASPDEDGWKRILAKAASM